MKILMLTTNSSLMDGINRHILTVAPALNRVDGLEVAVCTVFPRAELGVELEKKGVQTFSLDAAHGHDSKVFKAFYKVVRKFQPTIIHSHVMALYERMVLATLFRNIKYVVTIHGISDPVKTIPLRMRLEQALNKLFAIHYDAECYISKGVMQHLLNEGRQHSKAFVVYNPLQFGQVPDKTFQLHKLIGVSTDTPIIGTACRLGNVKQPKLFTEVMCKVLFKNSRVHAVVMGDGSDDMKQSLHEIVNRYQVNNRFHWLGYRQDAPELVSDLNCFVMTSNSEGLPTSILEAMVNKVTFAMMEGVGGLEDLSELNRLEGPFGLVTPKGDVDIMAEQIGMLIEQEKQQTLLAERAYQVGKKHFNVDSVVNKLFGIYKKVCGR